MNKDDAIRAMYDGKRVTHRWFSSHEWMTIDAKKKKFKFEDGYSVSFDAFWILRDDFSWQDGWKLYTKPKYGKQK